MSEPIEQFKFCEEERISNIQTLGHNYDSNALQSERLKWYVEDPPSLPHVESIT
jgi:hypothetical protein